METVLVLCDTKGPLLKDCIRALLAVVRHVLNIDHVMVFLTPLSDESLLLEWDDSQGSVQSKRVPTRRGVAWGVTRGGPSVTSAPLSC